jgi:propionate catabolism operon transcriptional regulator
LSVIRVLAIAPYPGLRDLLLDIAKEDPEVEIEVETADLGEAIPYVENAEQKGYDIIVSRGGTATLIRSLVSLPVVDIPVSGYDILRVLTLVRNTSSKVALIGFPNICHGVAEISSLLDYQISTYPIDHRSKVADTLSRAFQSDVQIVLGDTIAVRTAEQMGYRGILITSGRESVIDTMAEVHRIYDVYKRGQKQVEFYRDVVEADTQGIIVLDEFKRVKHANLAACRLLGQSLGQLRGAGLVPAYPSLAQLLAQAEESPSSEVFQPEMPIQNRLCGVHVSGFETEGKPHYLIRLDDSDNRGHLRHDEAFLTPRPVTFGQLVGTCPVFLKAVKTAQKYAKSSRNIWISGERGTEKSRFAQAIHSASHRSEEPFYTVTCGEIDLAQTEMLIAGKDHAPGLAHGGFVGTVFLKDADMLSREANEMWLTAIRGSRQTRFIASSSTPLTRLNGRADSFRELVAALNELHVTIPPLRDRKGDIDEIVRVLIAEYNSESGKQIVGLREPVLKRLLEYEWLGNVPELKHVVRELLGQTKGMYVEPGETSNVLNRLNPGEGFALVKQTHAQLDLSGTLQEIEGRILMHILQEEGMNQTKACKRLGINRSTLWRKINKDKTDS